MPCKEAHACMQANLYEHLASNANEERRRRYEYAYAELAQFMTIELLMLNCRGGIGLENQQSDRNGVENSGFGLRSTPVGAEQTSSGRLAPLALCLNIRQERKGERSYGISRT